MNKQTIILNWLPPASTDMPSPAMTVLKGALCKAGYKCKILYWNILLEDEIRDYLRVPSLERITEVDYLGIFYAYLAIEYSDKDALLKQEILLKSINPQYFSTDFNFEEHIREAVSKLKQRIADVINQEYSEDTLLTGFSMNLFQWIVASIIGTEIKSLRNDVLIAVGGIGNPRLAETFLRNFEQFDFALWGEGEVNLVELVRSYANPSEIPHIAYRKANGEVAISQVPLNQYPALTECANLEFDDYFNSYRGQRSKVSLFVEGSRGCHWNRCKFCFLNQGYRYRVKSASEITTEIRSLIEKYQVFTFSFLDNDIIGKDFDRFHNMLDLLIELKDTYPDFKINLAEIITRGLSKSEIKKMSLSGFAYVQIGYESVSDNILVKIDKKNSFASNLLFIKWATIYNINVVGLNILRGLLDETDSDILESINNVYFLRFFKRGNKIRHNVSMLAINKVSRYYRELSHHNETIDIYDDPIRDRLPSGFIKQEDDSVVYHLVRKHQNELWANFMAVDNYYDSSEFSYRLVENIDRSITFIEKRGDTEINCLSFDRTSLHWKLLMFCNEQVHTVTEIIAEFHEDVAETVKLTINQLYKQGILYYSPFREECVTIINTSKID